MIEEIAAVAQRDVSRETFERLQLYARLLKDEAANQNLISAATVHALWERHILDSAQLVRFEPKSEASWVDIGSGAGLPGIVLACLVQGEVTLIEPRRLRVEFLEAVIETLDLANRVSVIHSKVERVQGSFDVISARAVARLSKLLEISHHLSTGKTVWVLPKGTGAREELADAQRTWQGTFHVERSSTNDDSLIVVGTGVREKRR
jgi:16S rRNA (guanine527-N7)-methyltransferase